MTRRTSLYKGLTHACCPLGFVEITIVRGMLTSMRCKTKSSDKDVSPGAANREHVRAVCLGIEEERRKGHRRHAFLVLFAVTQLLIQRRSSTITHLGAERAHGSICRLPQVHRV
eukprot:scaffold77061_cov75-Phaeocystis_antarctica.AAC.3